jgi:hypothetical protein
MTRINKLIGLFAFALIALAMPTIASAQWNGGYGNGGYGNGRYNRDIRGTIENLRDGARNFERQIDRGNNGRYGNNNRYGNDRVLRNLADRFSDATKDLQNAYGRGRNLNNSADEARRVLDIASQINNELYHSRGDRYLENEWQRLGNELRVVADTYGYNGGYNNRNRNGNWRRNIPFPLPF